jgi:hypothetical protein
MASKVLSRIVHVVLGHAVFRGNAVDQVRRIHSNQSRGEKLMMKVRPCISEDIRVLNFPSRGLWFWYRARRCLGLISTGFVRRSRALQQLVDAR